MDLMNFTRAKTNKAYYIAINVKYESGLENEYDEFIKFRKLFLQMHELYHSQYNDIDKKYLPFIIKMADIMILLDSNEAIMLNIDNISNLYYDTLYNLVQKCEKIKIKADEDFKIAQIQRTNFQLNKMILSDLISFRNQSETMCEVDPNITNVTLQSNKRIKIDQ